MHRLSIWQFDAIYTFLCRIPREDFKAMCPVYWRKCGKYTNDTPPMPCPFDHCLENSDKWLMDNLNVQQAIPLVAFIKEGKADEALGLLRAYGMPLKKL